MMTIIIELFLFLFWTRSVYGGSSLARRLEGTRAYSEYKFVLDDSDFSEYSDVTVWITGYCTHGTGSTVIGLFNECEYNSFGFKVYSGDNYLGETRRWAARKNVLSCNEAYTFSLPVDETDLRPGTNQIRFTVTKSGGDACAPAPASEGDRRRLEGTREYSEYKFDLDDSDFSEYSDVSVYIHGYCKANTMHGTETTVNGAYNECVYDSFVFKVYSGNDYLGDTRPWKAKRNVLSCNEAYSVSLPVGLPVNGFRINTNQIHFTVTKTGGGACAPAPAPVIEGDRRRLEGTREYSEYKFDLDESDFSEYSDVSVDITGYCKANTMHGTETTVNGPFNECVYDSFDFEVYSGENYLGDTRPWKAKRNVLSCNEAYNVSLPVGSVDESGFRINTNQIHFTVTKSGGGSC